ncbi:unnamed protein product [Caenorhabditis sp. 36 PRJEB53466]|nr:unnamed protein product [Caenorhabditis sp. 36 PRJEB53466]
MGSNKEKEWMDDCLQRLETLSHSKSKSIVDIMSGHEIIAILRLVEKSFMDECNLIEVEAPIKIIGDIHAQWHDLDRLFEVIGRVPEQKMMFLGNYVDMGGQGIEVTVTLFCLKIRHPRKMFLLRGNHEIPEVNKVYGFYSECETKYGAGLWWDFQSVFNRIPMAGLVSKRVLCVHGGLSPFLRSLDDIRNIPRPCEPQNRGLVTDLLWSDPTNRGDGWFYSVRGISYMFGKAIVENACKTLKVSLIIRSHMVVQNGYEVMSGRKLITVFSMPNFLGLVSNSAAVLHLNARLEVFHQIIHPSVHPPHPSHLREASPLARDLDPHIAFADQLTVRALETASKT